MKTTAPSAHGPAISDSWAARCSANADRRAGVLLGLAVLSIIFVTAVIRAVESRWSYVLVVLLVPLCVELAVPGLRHFLTRSRTRLLMAEHSWRPVAAEFVPGRARVGRQTYLDIEGYDRSFLRLPGMPDRVREQVRRSGRVWLAGPDDKGHAVVVTDARPFLTLGRIVVR
ncbi:hypothetical protein [Umezawaea beigongshangensis]|uniref:hypothetical protein n=1 Tax=Umezawaea beigongshangensis TaxID=2780383 RepID=UPI0018F195F8|nr:hypothetical protein [Umezawaea beigongshangensis]